MGDYGVCCIANKPLGQGNLNYFNAGSRFVKPPGQWIIDPCSAYYENTIVKPLGQ